MDFKYLKTRIKLGNDKEKAGHKLEENGTFRALKNMRQFEVYGVL